MRKPPGSPPEITKKQIDTIITQERVYELITPLFGGGVNPGEADPLTTIRGTEIRGQLRFWWRACRGGKPEFNGDPAKMKQAENKIWGAAYKKGEPTIPQDETVQIAVEVLKLGIPVKAFQIEEKDGRKQVKPNPASASPPYVAFPLQPSQEEQQQEDLKLKEVRRNVSFKLTISFPVNHRIDVQAALWAWETFGGVGARTRRGFGALRCTSITENGQSISLELPQASLEGVKGWIGRGLWNHIVDGSWPDNVPHLIRRPTEGIHFKLMSSTDSSNPLTTWKDLIEQLRRFRQQRLQSREGVPHRGRSRWPEPSAIRQYTGQSLQGHDSPIPNPPIDKFPRAAFGLPIIFQFNKRDLNKRNPADPNSDPRKTILQPKSSERFASPLILKPLACQKEEYVGLALILDGTRLGTEELELKTQEEPFQAWNVQASLNGQQNLRFQDRNRTIQIDSQTDALQAFLKYL